ncbi:nuclease-related domain-containing protein [Sporolactobacillus laevolacticus]|uniref:nuclease-related domain-containing protein n=1 Tax=Sporolactobacillus laevolacticus TaxID=33018 RepID=UPI0025B37804|nr:nuclease-related domain-containing protein [Sporolactobacillus laevolacticus]MDN3954698.1 nuclease-related domain-containing protein [Sporolactobacillus laevolacticus]
MIVKKLQVPWRVLADQALLEHLGNDHPARAQIEADLAKRQAGFRGELNLAYYLDTFQKEDWHIFYSLKLEDCQIDTLLLTPTFISLLESKNYFGAVRFEPDGQFMRRVADRYEGYANPLLQVGRHRALLRKWLADHGLPKLPIEADVVIAFPATIIENPGKLRHVQEHVFHAEQAPMKLEKLIEKYKHTHNFFEFIPQIEHLLLQEHNDKPINVLNLFNIHPSELRRGVRCDKCRSFDMQRIYANWFCPRCGYKSKTAHIPMILHYFLLFGSTMTNKQCRAFLRVDKCKTMTDLLSKMNLQRGGSGFGNGLYYKSPSHETFDRYFRDKQDWRKRIWNRK